MITGKQYIINEEQPGEHAVAQLALAGGGQLQHHPGQQQQCLQVGQGAHI